MFKPKKNDPGMIPGEVQPQPAWGYLEIVAVYLCVIGLLSAFEFWGQAFYSWSVPIIAGSNYEIGHFYISSLLQYFATLLAVGLTVAWADRGSWADLGIRPASFGDVMTYGILGGALLFVLVLGFSFLLLWINPDVSSQTYAQMLSHVNGTWDFLYVFCIGAVVAPIVEEIYFRGMIYPVLRQQFGVYGGIVLCGVIFGAAHFDLWRGIPLAIGGMVLAYIYEKTGSVLVCALAHGMWNGVMSFMLFANLLS